MTTFQKGETLFCTVRPRKRVNIYDCQKSTEKIGDLGDIYISAQTKSVLVTRYNIAKENTIQIGFNERVSCTIEKDFVKIGERRHDLFRLRCNPP